MVDIQAALGSRELKEAIANYLSTPGNTSVRLPTVTPEMLDLHVDSRALDQGELFVTVTLRGS
jgi:hypothetical protein